MTKPTKKKVYVVLLEDGGIPDDPQVFADVDDWNAHGSWLILEQGFGRKEGESDEDHLNAYFEVASDWALPDEDLSEEQRELKAGREDDMNHDHLVLRMWECELHDPKKEDCRPLLEIRDPDTRYLNYPEVAAEPKELSPEEVIAKLQAFSVMPELILDGCGFDFAYYGVQARSQPPVDPELIKEVEGFLTTLFGESFSKFCNFTSDGRLRYLSNYNHGTDNVSFVGVAYFKVAEMIQCIEEDQAQHDT